MNAKPIRCPFVLHESRWYVIIGWRKTMKPGTPLRLRPLNRRESQIVNRYIENFGAEAWALIAVKDQSSTASTKR